jgi:hypothetical protein
MDTRTSCTLRSAFSNGENIQSKLLRMQASLDSLIQNIKATGPATARTKLGQPIVYAEGLPSPLADSNISRTASDGGSDTAAKGLNLLVGIGDTMHCISGLQDAMDSLRSRVSPSCTVYLTTEQSSFQHPLWPLSRNEAFDMVDGLREEVETLYPFVDLTELTELLNALYSPVLSQKLTRTQISGWSDMDDSRNIGLLKLITACSITTRGKEESDRGRELMKTVEEENMRRMSGLDVDMKDLAIATMLVSCSS